MRAASIPGPTESAVSLSELKDHCHVSGDDESYLLNEVGLAATAFVERWTQRLLSPRAVVLRLAQPPCGKTPLDIPGGVVQALTSVEIDGVTVSGLSVHGDSPARIYPTDDWPAAVGTDLPVVVTYTAGYTAAPYPLKQAVKLIAAELFDQRRQGSEKPMTTAPVSAEYLMANFRIRAV